MVPPHWRSEMQLARAHVTGISAIVVGSHVSGRAASVHDARERTQSLVRVSNVALRDALAHTAIRATERPDSGRHR